MDNITLPENYLHLNSITVRIDDINYGNHLDFSRLASYLANCRATFFKENNFKEINDNGIGIITKSMHIDYKRQLLFNQDVYILMDIQNIKGASADLVFGVFTKENDSIQEAAKGSIKLAFINYKSNRPCRVPLEFLNLTEISNRISLEDI